MTTRWGHARNVVIVFALAAAVWALPGGGRAADLVSAVLAVAFAAGIALFGGRMYLDNRVAVHGLGDRHRALLYGAVAVAFLTLAATSSLQSTGAGTVVWVALLAACAWALIEVFRHSRQY